MMHVDKSPFEAGVHMVEAIYYSPYMKPIQVLES